MENLTSSKNPFVLQDEVFFISYTDIVKSIYPYLLKKISTELVDDFKDLLKLESFSKYDEKNLLTLAYQRPHPNMLEYLAKEEFDYNQALFNLVDIYPEVYNKSELLSIGANIEIFMKEKFIKKIYIYSEVYDPRIHYDIQSMYKDMEIVQYAYGPLTDVLDKLESRPTTFFLNDIDYAIELFSDKKYSEFTNILIADYNYNYIVDDEGNRDFRIDLEEFNDDIVCKIGTFPPIKFTEEHLSQFEVTK